MIKIKTYQTKNIKNFSQFTTEFVDQRGNPTILGLDPQLNLALLRVAI